MKPLSTIFIEFAYRDLIEIGFSIISLLSLEESDSWLGNRDNLYIYNYDCYDDDIGRASWLSNMINAQNWQYFVSNSTIDNLIDVGRDVERSVLARAVRLFTEHRILLNGPKTVVFD